MATTIEGINVAEVVDLIRISSLKDATALFEQALEVARAAGGAEGAIRAFERMNTILDKLSPAKQ